MSSTLWTWTPLEQVGQDLKFALRGLRRSLGFTTVAILTLALAIGANAAILSFADAVLFRALPYEDPDRVFILLKANNKTGQRSTSIPAEYLHAIETRHQGVGPIGFLVSGPRVQTDTPEGVRDVPVVSVNPTYFETLGTRAARGRTLAATDAASPGRPTLLSYAAWRDRFGGDETLVGRSVSLGGTTFDVVGVLPPRFVFPTRYGGGAELVTLMDTAQQARGSFYPIVRLEHDTTREQAMTEMNALIRPLAERDARTANSTVVIEDVRSVLYPVARTIMLFLATAAGLVLVIGCANLANMLLVRTARQERDTGVRAALGASHLRLVRQLLFESLIIGLVSAALAVLAAAYTFEMLVRQVPRLAYGNAPVGVDVRVAIITLAMGLLAGFGFAVVPAWRAARKDVQVLLQARHRSAARQRRWFRQPLIVVQVATAIVLVFGAVVAGRAFIAVLNVPLGFDPKDVVTLDVWPSDKGSGLQEFYGRAIETLARRSDVVSVGAVGSKPLDGSMPDEGVHTIEGAATAAGIVHILPGYFETVRIGLRRGRLVDWNDVQGASNAAVISESAAAAVFPGQDPIGKSFTNGGGRRFTVVGVVADVKKSLNRDSREIPPAYVIPGESVAGLTIVARMRQGTRREAMLAELKREIALMAPRTMIAAAWWDESVAAVAAYRNPRFQTIVLGGFAVLALVLTALGIIGVVGQLVAARTREMGIRVAVGATPRSLVTLTMRETMLPVGFGLVAGLIATRVLAGLAEAQLFALDTKDPLTLAGATLTVLLAALVAAYAPARRAARVDPIVVLRAE